MSSPRFFVPELAAGAAGGGAAARPGQVVTLPASVSHHARRVLRLRPGDAIVLFDGQGREYAARLLEATGDATPNASRSGAHIESDALVDREARVAITLVQALSAQEKIDWLIEKSVELGVHRLILAPAERSVVRLDETRQERRLARWQDIVVAACSQCGRNRLPQVHLAPSLDAALRLARDGAAQRWILDPAAAAGLAAAPAAPGATTGLACAVGPEGGFSAAELAAAYALGYTPARLGPRVLRTETAGLAAAAALLALHGEYD